MAESSGFGGVPNGDCGKWEEIERRYWRDLRYGSIWIVTTQLQRDLSSAGDSQEEASVFIVFDGPDLHRSVRWSDPKPLSEVSNETLQDLLNQAMEDAVAPPPRPLMGASVEQLPVREVPQPELQTRDHVAGLQVYGTDVSRETLDTLSVQLGLFLEELDRGASGADSARFDWRTVDPSFRGNRVLVAPNPLPVGAAARFAERILERARRGISMLYGRPVRPPGFTDVSLTYLEWMTSAFESSDVTRLVFFAVGRTAAISRGTRRNLRAWIQSAEGAGAWDAEVG